LAIWSSIKVGVLQNESDMVDGIVDIPIQGRTIGSIDGQESPAAHGHFFAGPENRLVEVAIHSVLAGPPKHYSPLVLYGPSGTGKSHIARGVAAEWKSSHRRDHLVCVTAVDFSRELVDAIETQAVDEFRTRYRNASLLVIEDLGMLTTDKSEKLNVQEELIYTLDAMADREGWVIVTASASPNQLPNICPGLQSRLIAGLMIPLAPPELEARMAILQQLAELRKVDLSPTMIRTMAEGIRGTAPDLAGALIQLETPIQFDGGTLDEEAVQEFVESRGGSRRVTLHDIALATAKHFSLKLSDLRSAVRRRSLVTARGVAIYLARQFTAESLDQIGDYFGGRDHTTVMHGCRKTEALIESDPTVREAVQILQKKLYY
jgi:chromosomal replication initiator protein